MTGVGSWNPWMTLGGDMQVVIYWGTLGSVLWLGGEQSGQGIELLYRLGQSPELWSWGGPQSCPR